MNNHKDYRSTEQWSTDNGQHKVHMHKPSVSDCMRPIDVEMSVSMCHALERHLAGQSLSVEHARLLEELYLSLGLARNAYLNDAYKAEVRDAK